MDGLEGKIENLHVFWLHLKIYQMQSHENGELARIDCNPDLVGLSHQISKCPSLPRPALFDLVGCLTGTVCRTSSTH